MSGTWARPGLVTATVRRNISPDAVVIVPGIMGSALESANGPLWGFRELRTYARIWSRRNPSLGELALTDDERDGRYGRVRATGLVEFPAWAPFLQGFEPYPDLVAAVRRVVAHPAAVREFAYDWRLPVAHNAGLLADAAAEHLKAWRNHCEYLAMLRELPDRRPARLVLVAHSMGGLLVRALPLVSGVALDIRATVTLGTPFDGAAKSAVILNRGEGGAVPLPRAQLRELAATLPGVHDLLPHYRCLDTGNDDPSRLTPAEVAELGGDRDLATAAFDFHRRTAAVPLVGHRAVTGTAQPTVQSLGLRAGTVIEHRHTFVLDPAGGFERNRHGVLVRIDDHGDGTVPRNSADLSGVGSMPLAQQHGALARTPEAIEIVCNVITGRDPDAPRLGDGEIGLSVPDVVAPGDEWPAVVTGVDGPNDASCVVADGDGRPVDHPPLHRRDGVWQATVVLPAPGIYRVTVEGGGGSAVTQLVLADAGADADG